MVCVHGYDFHKALHLIWKLGHHKNHQSNEVKLLHLNQAAIALPQSLECDKEVSKKSLPKDLGVPIVWTYWKLAGHQRNEVVSLKNLRILLCKGFGEKETLPKIDLADPLWEK